MVEIVVFGLRKRVLAYLGLLAVIAFVLQVVSPSLPFPVRAAGNVYYVAKSGSDSNLGTEAQPWLTIQKAANTAVAGDTVYVKSGTYKETIRPANSGLAGNPIIYKAYPGEKVIIDGSGVLTGWTLHSGNIYKTSIDWPYGLKTVWENGYSASEIRLISQGAIPTGPAQFYYDSMTRTVYVWLKDGGNPNSKTMIGDKQNPTVNFADRTYLILDGFEVAYGTINISIRNSNNIELRNSVFRDPGQSSNISGSGAEYAHIHHNTVLRGANGGIFLANGAHDNLIEYNTVKDVWNEDAIGLSTQPDPMGNNNVIQYNDLSGSEEDGIDIYSGAGQIIRGNRIHHNSEKGINLHGATNSLVERNVVYSNGWYGLYMGTQNGTGDNNLIQDNIFYDNCISNSDPSYVVQAPRNSFINNTFVGISSASRELFAISGNATNINFKNNVFYHSSMIFRLSTTDMGVISDYNLFYTASSILISWLGTNYANLTSWQTSSGQDKHSIAQNPEFANATSKDFRLKTGSPAIDAGTSDGAPTADLEGNLRYDEPNTSNTGGGTYTYYDIGAYEYQGSSVVGLDHFTFNTIGSTQTAGNSFAVTITAKDATGATLASFNGTVTLSDASGTISPWITGGFINGVWTGNVIITKAQPNNFVRASGGGKIGTSNSFNVVPSSLHHINISPTSATLQTGGSQSFSAQGYDAYNNPISGLTYTWSARGGTVSPTIGSSTTFTAGSTAGTGSVTVSSGGISSSAAITINAPTGVTLPPSSPYGAHPNGLLVKTATTPSVYVLEEGKKRWISSPVSFVSNGFRWDRIITIPDSEMVTYSNSSDLRIRPGTLIKGSGPAVYVVDLASGSYTRRWITTPAVFGALGYRWEDILTVSDTELSSYNEGASISTLFNHSNGALIKSAGSPAVYLLEEGKKRWITSPASFVSNSFRWDRIITVSDSEMANYPSGPNLRTRPGTLLRGSGPAVYATDLISGSYQKRWITSSSAFESLGFRWVDIILVSDSELSSYVDAPNVTL